MAVLRSVSSMISTMARPNALASASGLPSHVTDWVAGPAERRVSARSNETTGTSCAMYSRTLFMVDRSLKGVFGSGHSPTSAVDR